jgi:hypothetical protein
MIAPMFGSHMTDDTGEQAAAELYRLVYFSRNHISECPLETVAEIEAILAASRRNNSAFGITGALIFNGGVFAQVLEGPQRSVEAAFARIQCDTRHGDVTTLVFEPAKQRLFPNWSMGFIGRSQEGRDLFAHVGVPSGAEAPLREAERILTLMQEIVLAEEEAA